MTHQDIIDELRKYEPREIIYTQYEPQPEEVYGDWWLPRDFSQWEVQDILDEFAADFNLPPISTPEIRRTTDPSQTLFAFTILLPY